MNRHCGCGVALLLGVAGIARAQFVSYDFEPPAYLVGSISGQQGWAAPGNPVLIDNTVARIGTQSLHIQTPSGATANHFNGLSSNLGWGASWSLYINSAGTNATSFCSVSLGTALGRSWYLGVYGDGRLESFGTPVLHDTLGLGALNQWLDISVSGYNPTGDVDILIQGVGINRSFHTTMPVQGVRQDYVVVDMNNELFNSDTGGNFYVDNLTVSFVPTPGVVTGLIVTTPLLVVRRRRQAGSR